MLKYQYQIVANNINKEAKPAVQIVSRGIVEGGDICRVSDQIANVAWHIDGEIVQITVDICKDENEG